MGKVVASVLQVGLTAVGFAIGTLILPGIGGYVGAALGSEAGHLIASAAFPARSQKPAQLETALKIPRPPRLSGYAVARDRSAYILADAS